MRGTLGGACGGRVPVGVVTGGVFTGGVVVTGVVIGGTVTVGRVNVGSVTGGGGSGGRAAAEADQPAVIATTIEVTCRIRRRSTGLIRNTCAFQMP